MCQVTMWGGRAFDGWEHTFSIGDYNSAELEFRGLKCDDISSLEVVGDFCMLTGYEYGDFNRIHAGWEANFTQGKYDVHDMESRGAMNNDMSSLKVFFYEEERQRQGFAVARYCRRPDRQQALRQPRRCGRRLGAGQRP
jgi:hypothetical protein